MRKRGIVIFAVILSIIPASCRLWQETYTTEVVDGVRHIHNHAPLWGSRPEAVLEFVQKIGVLDGNDRNYLLHMPLDVTVDGDGNIYILDAGNYRIQKYNAAGEFLATIGGKGTGPGEIPNRPVCMDIDTGNVLYVAHTNVVIQRYLTDGADAGRIRGFHYIHFIRHFSTDELITRSFFGFEGISTPASSEPLLLVVFSPRDGKVIRTFGSPIVLDDPYESSNINAIFADIDSDDNVYVSFEHRNRIDKYDYEGRYILSIDRPLSYDVREKPVWVETGPERKTPFVPQFTTVSRGIAADGSGRIWVITARENMFSYERDAPVEESGRSEDESLYEFHVFDSGGVFLGALPVPAAWRRFNMRIFGSRLFLIEHVNEMAVHEYRIVERQAP